MSESTRQTWEAYALRYATSRSARSTRFHRYAARFPDGDAEIGMDFYFWLLRSGDEVVLVDCGFDPSQDAFPHYQVSTHPLELLSRLGVKAEDVGRVILTHMHFDHVGNVGLFPKAGFTMARAEYEFWTGPLANKPDIGVGAIPSEIDAVKGLMDAGKLDLIDHLTEVVPGVTVRPVRGHTAGQLLTEVTTDVGTVVIASDTFHFYEEIERELPFWLFHDLEGVYEGYELLRDYQSRPGFTVVAGHDPSDMQRFVEVAPECIDLTKTLH